MAPKNRRKPTSYSASGNRPSSSSTTEDHPGWETREGGNKFQFKGPKSGFESKAVKEGLYLRIDMPGVADEGVEVWTEEKELFFSGEAHPLTDIEQDMPSRVYGGCIDLSSDSGEITEVKTFMKNGVLRIVLVGCEIKPDLSDREPLWRPGLPKPRPTPPSKTFRHEISMVGDYLVGFRSWSPFLDPPDESSTGIYPFQISGPLESSEMKPVMGNHLFVRVDMPDVPSEGLTVKVRDNVVFWDGKGVKCSSEDDEEIRGYFGTQKQICGCCNYVLVKSAVKFGVFRMLLEVKKIKPASESADAIGNTDSSQGCV